MKITKIGHCCLLIEEGEVRLLTDPGAFSTGQDEVEDIDAVLITHEHVDHLHIDSLRKVIDNNPDVRVICNTGVAGLLDKEGIDYELMVDGQTLNIAGVDVRAYEAPHAEMFPGYPQVPNTGFFFGDVLFYPGDVFIEPGAPVDVLAAPVAGPWMKLSDAVSYILKVKPRLVIPVHDGMMKQAGAIHPILKQECEKAGIEARPLADGETVEA